MTMTILWTGMVVLSILCGLATGQSAQVAAAAVEGTQAAVELCLSIAGMLCLWTGVMEVMRRVRAGRKAVPAASTDAPAALSPGSPGPGDHGQHRGQCVGQFAGAGQRCHPSGAGGRRRMSRCSPGVASDALCMLVVCNTASIQLIPTTVATVRAGAGSAAPLTSCLPFGWPPGCR